MTKIRFAFQWLFILGISCAALAAAGTAVVEFITYEQALPVLKTSQHDLPGELQKVAADRMKSNWPEWVQNRDREVRARLDQGEEDTLTNLLRFGVTYTKQPRIDWPSLFQYGQNAGVTFMAQERTDDLIRALANPGTNEHFLTMRAFLEKKGFHFRTPSDRNSVRTYLLANLSRMQAEFAGYQEKMKALQASKADESKLMELDSHLFEKRGISLDTNVRPNFAIDQALKDLASRGLLKAGAVHRAAIIGPGLDFVNKEEGADFYPPQTIQPFALMDSLIRYGLADQKTLEIVTYDISSSVNQHIHRAKNNAAANRGYTIQLPLDGTKTWSSEFTAYWNQFGNQIGTPTKAFPVPDETPELKIRAVRIRPEHLSKLSPIEMNVVFQREVLPDARQFDIVIGTNIFVYYGPFEQALARANLSSMIRPAGLLLSNNFLAGEGLSELRHEGRTTVALSKRGETETIFWYRRSK
jgi:hypothetical protein